MKVLSRLLVVVFCGAFISSCFEPPEYPNTPEIVYKNIEFIDVPDLPDGTISTDSLILTVKFKDGDGDLGLTTGEIGPPNNDVWFFVKTPLTRNEKLIDDCSRYAAQHKCWFYYDPLVPAVRPEYDKFIKFKDRKKAPFDTLPDFTKPQNCTNWFIVKDKENRNMDTLYFQLNPHYSNIFVEFQIKTPDNLNPYVPFNWSTFLDYPSCETQGFNGRFPLLTETPGTASPLEGEIRYAMPSQFFKVIFGAQTIRLKVSIEDRALNKSNVIYTNDFNF